MLYIKQFKKKNYFAKKSKLWGYKIITHPNILTPILAPVADFQKLSQTNKGKKSNEGVEKI